MAVNLARVIVLKPRSRKSVEVANRMVGLGQMSLALCGGMAVRVTTLELSLMGLAQN